MIERVLIDHGGALVSDFQRYYGLDLMTCVYETHSPDNLVALVTWLPGDSAFAASMRGGQEFYGWDSDRYLRAGTLETLMMLENNFIRANTDKKNMSKIPQVKPLEIPGRDLTKKPNPNRGEFGGMVKALFDAQKPG